MSIGCENRRRYSRDSDGLPYIYPRYGLRKFGNAGNLIRGIHFLTDSLAPGSDAVPHQLLEARERGRAAGTRRPQCSCGLRYFSTAPSYPVQVE